MGDIAVAVNPDDERYRSSLGKTRLAPARSRASCRSSAMPAIDPEFGTGVLKVTPAHDKLDFEIGQRHNLPVIDVLHPNGRINCPGVRSSTAWIASKRAKKAAEMLAERGLLAKEEPYENNVGFSERARCARSSRA